MWCPHRPAQKYICRVCTLPFALISTPRAFITMLQESVLALPHSIATPQEVPWPPNIGLFHALPYTFAKAPKTYPLRDHVTT